ncbi:MAG: ATP phosphoribosyltransferase [Clostridia bacterium]|nr:ATP phosphoribosyltransferase [Clostridia bacterium]
MGKFISCNYATRISKEHTSVESICTDESVVIETINAYGKRFSNVSELQDILSMSGDANHHHPLTGPIEVKGAKKGDMIKIHIEKIEILEMAQMLSKTAGISPIKKDDFSFSDRMATMGEIKSGQIEYYHSGIKLKLEPCIGMIATTPEEGFIKTGHIGVTGGNFDNPFIKEGVDIYLPVQLDGAMLYLGDVHAVQSYGELSGVALEASANVTIRVSIVKPWKPFQTDPIFIMGKEPLTGQNALAVIGIGKSFKNGDEAVRDAFFKSIEVIKRLKPTMPEYLIRSMLSLVGNSMAGQAYSNTSESTSQILLTEEGIRTFHTTENDNILAELEKCIFNEVNMPRTEEKILVTIGAVKGRLQKVLHKYLESIGVSIPKISDRILVYDIETDRYILRISLLKWADITKNYDKFDFVIYGADKWLEKSNKSFVALKFFEQKDCRMSLLVPERLKEMPLSFFKERKIATSYPNLLKEHLNVPDENILLMEGSVEASIPLGWASSIFDVVETGETAKENGLVEYMPVMKFGAVLATSRVDKIPLFVNLGLVDRIEKFKCIAFDGIDGSGKSTLAKVVVQNGLFKFLPTVLVEPFSGKVGRESFALWKDGKFVDWSMCIAKKHWRANEVVNMVYDRSVLTGVVDLFKARESEEMIKKVLQSWMPLPDVLLYCKVDPSIAYERSQQRSKKDEFESLESLQEYYNLYEEAVNFLRENKLVNVIELDVSKTTSEVIEDVKEILEEELK